jgi:hypothetical protein
VSTGHARRSARIAALGIALVATALGACGDGDDPAVDTTTTDSTRRSTSTSTTSTITSAPTTTTTVYLSAIDEAAPTVTVDLVELLTGQAAVDAYREDTGEALDGEQFYLRDRNDLERTLPVDAGAGPYSIIDAESCCDPIEVGFAGLVAVRDQVEAAGGADAPFTLTVQGGVVTSAVQLYLP